MDTEAATPYRYVVLVWFYDHWGLNTQTNDYATAEKACAHAREFNEALRPRVIDTHPEVD